MTIKPITIVTVTYNSSKNISSFLNSIIESDNLLLINKIILIENNSPEKNETISIVNIFKAKYPNLITFISSKVNNGFAKSCNIGAKLSKSKYILFLNPDTKIMNDSLRILYEHSRICHADIIGGVSKKDVNNIHLTVVRHPSLTIGLFELTNLGKIFGIKRGHSDFYYQDLQNLYRNGADVEVDAVGGAYMMVKTSSFMSLKGFDEKFFMYLEDVDLGFRANVSGMKVYFCPHSTIDHIGGASSTNKYHIRHQAWYDSRRYYFTKHHNYLVNMLIQPIFIFEEYILKIRNYFNYL